MVRQHGFDISSFGTNTLVRLPGPTAETQNVYAFDCSYEEMLEDLKLKDFSFYLSNGLIAMLERNSKIKATPQRFIEAGLQQHFDVIFTCEEKCFDFVCQELNVKGNSSGSKPVLVVNFEIKDNHEEATIGAKEILKLANAVSPQLPI